MKMNEPIDEVAETKLWMAVLQQAIEDMKSDTYRIEASDWFTSKRHGVGSFLWIADLFDINAPLFRRIVLNNTSGLAEAESSRIHYFNKILVRLTRRAALCISQ